MEASMPKSRRKRTTYSNTKRQAVLKAAQKQGLTALEVQKRFGVTPVTYYSWRRKYGASGGREVAGRTTGRSAGIETQVRTEVQARVREILPNIVRTEVSQYLDSVFGSSRGRARKA
jgi:transposase-like protein